MTGLQRGAARTVGLSLCAAWAVLGVDLILIPYQAAPDYASASHPIGDGMDGAGFVYLVAGALVVAVALTAGWGAWVVVGRVTERVWSWGAVAALVGALACVSLAAAPPAAAVAVGLAVLLGMQALWLAAFAALLWPGPHSQS